MAARTLFHFLIIDSLGDRVAGEKVHLYKKGTTVPISDTLWSASAGGNVLINPLTTDNSGSVNAWLDIPGTDVPGYVTVSWDDNSGAATPSGVAGTDVVGIYPAPPDTVGQVVTTPAAAHQFTSAFLETDGVNWMAYLAGDSTPYFTNADPAIVVTKMSTVLAAVGGGTIGWRNTVTAKSPFYLNEGVSLVSSGDLRKPADYGSALWQADAAFAGDFLGVLAGDGSAVHGGQFDVLQHNATTNTNLGYGCIAVLGNRCKWSLAATYGNNESAPGDDNSYSMMWGTKIANHTWGTNKTITGMAWAAGKLTLVVNNVTDILAGDPVNISGVIPTIANVATYVVDIPDATHVGVALNYDPGALTQNGTLTGRSGGSAGADGLCHLFDFRTPNKGTAFALYSADLNMGTGHIHGAGTGTRMAYFKGQNTKAIGVHFEAGAGTPLHLVEVNAGSVVIKGLIGSNNGSNGIHLTNTSSGILDLEFNPENLPGAATVDAITIDSGGANWSIRVHTRSTTNKYRRGITCFANNILAVTGSVFYDQQTLAPWDHQPTIHGGNIHNGTAVEGQSLAVTDAASVAPDGIRGDTIFTINGTRATRTIVLPVNMIAGQRIIYNLQNNSGGVTTTTFDGSHKMPAWTDPANTKQRNVTFWFDGTNLIELSRNAADI